MEEKNTTALMCCFARAYHSKNYKYPIFNDYIAEKILSEEEYKKIFFNLEKGINFISPNFKGTGEEAVRWIIDNQISPSILARSIFTEDCLKSEIKLGISQYLIFAAGYDTSAYRNNSNISVFEIDRNDIIDDKIRRLDMGNIKHNNINYLKCDFTRNSWISKIINSNYDKNKKSFCSLLGISYYLTIKEFEKFLSNISSIICEGSVIIFDYPTTLESEEKSINEKLAAKCNEQMKAKYKYEDIENIADKNNLLIYKNLDHNDIDKEYFYNYNTLNPNNKILAPIGIDYCLIIKKTSSI